MSTTSAWRARGPLTAQFVTWSLALLLSSGGIAVLAGCERRDTSSPPAAPPAAEHALEAGAPDASAPVSDSLATSQGELKMTPVHHGTLYFEWQGKTVWIDPWSQGNLEGRPPADFLFITDIHPDHLDPAAIDRVKKPTTVFLGPAAVAPQVPGLVVIKNGESRKVDGFGVEGVAMYNLKRGPKEGQFFHDKGRGNGYVFTFGDKRVYVSGDTECTPEMRALKDIDVAFVCMNVPYTMPPEEAAECVKAFRPKVVVPYHYRGSNLETFQKALAGEPGITVRLRNWY